MRADTLVKRTVRVFDRDHVARGRGRLDVAREDVELRDLGGGDALEREVERTLVDDPQHLVRGLER